MPDAPLYTQKGFGLKQEVQAPLERDYTSPVVDLLKAGNFSLTVGDLTLRLAREFEGDAYASRLRAGASPCSPPTSPPTSSGPSGADAGSRSSRTRS